MAFPPPILPTNRTNADPQQDTHPADHNALSLAINDMVVALPRGRIAHINQGATVDIFPSANLMTISFALAEPRWVRITAAYSFLQVTGNAPDTNATITINGAGNLRIRNGAATAGIAYYETGSAYALLPAGTNTTLLACSCSGGAMRVTPGFSTYLYVEDIGPA